MGVQILDQYYLSITLLITIAYQLFFFFIAFGLKFDKLTDFAGGTNFFVLAILTLLLGLPTLSVRSIVASVLLAAWAARLAGFLLYRIIKSGTDTRFDDKRDKFFSFLGFWVSQMVWVWVVSMPVIVLNSPAVGGGIAESFGSGRDIVGVIFWAVGIILETWADLVRIGWRNTREQTGKAVCDIGPWKWSRHPNYFGEIILQFGIFMIAVSPAADGYIGGQAYNALYATILGPFFLTALLLFVSGLPLQERPTAKKQYEKGTNWPEYETYLKSTSILIPLPPQLYAPMPTILKRTIFLEFPIYVFDPVKHGKQGDVERMVGEGTQDQSQSQ